MKREKTVALWTTSQTEATPFLDRKTTVYEHKVTVSFGTLDDADDQVVLKQYCRRQRTKIWVLENEIRVPRWKLREFLG